MSFLGHFKIPGILQAQYLKNRNGFNQLGQDYLHVFRILVKTYLLIKFWKWLDLDWPDMQINTPVWLDKRALKHPIVPPFWIPHPTDPKEEKERTKFDDFIYRVKYDVGKDFKKLLYLGTDHPQREASTIIDEYFYDNDTDRIFTEMKHTTNIEMLKRKIIPASMTMNKMSSSDDREEMRQALKAKIKPC